MTLKYGNVTNIIILAFFIIINSQAWFQASAAMQKRTALFWAITQRVVVIYYRRFGTIYRSQLRSSRILEL